MPARNKTKSNEPTPRKPRGRPGEAAAVDVRGAILEQAEALFAENGYSATSVRSIADAAGVTPAMIHYYFGNKEALLRAVLDKAVQPLAVSMDAMRSAQEVPPERIAESLMKLVDTHPRLPQLIIREVLLPGGAMKEHYVQNLAPRLGGALPGLLAREANQGRTRKDLPPETGALAIMSLALFPFIVRPLAEEVFDIRLSGKALATFTAQISEFVQRGFSP
jgi:TetR/AcrR family transcriptional regulator